MGVMGMRASEDEALQRPHAQLFAMSLRLLLSAIGLSGEGKCLPLIKQRAAVAFEKCVGGGTSSSVNTAWFSSPELLGTFATQLMRTAYDMAPKQYRAQFICALSRAAWIEESSGELLRENWAMIFKTFPEIPTWRLLETRIRERTWAEDLVPGDENASKDQFLNDLKHAVSDVRKLSANGDDMQSGKLRVATAMKAAMAAGIPQDEIVAASNLADPSAIASKWAFIPAADILLSVGDGMVGTTFEGTYVHHKQKKSIHGVWAAVTPPPGVVHIDFEVRSLVQEFEINDPGAIEKLLTHCLNRPNAKSGEIGEIRAALRSAGRGADLDEIFSRMVLGLVDKHNNYQSTPRDAGNRGKGVQVQSASWQSGKGPGNRSQDNSWGGGRDKWGGGRDDSRGGRDDYRGSRDSRGGRDDDRRGGGRRGFS